MSDYTPTTEEVYRAHWRGTPMRSEDGLREHVALDRWLAEVIRKACNHTFAQQLEEHSLAELIRMAKADAWEEGYAHGNADAFTEARLDRDNPYRQGETE